MEVTFRRINGGSSLEQSFVISDPNTGKEYYSEGGATPNTTYSKTICLKRTKNLQYSLTLSWQLTSAFFFYDSSNIEFLGEWGNRVFRCFWLNLAIPYSISFYSPVNDHSLWYYSTSVRPNWLTDNAFNSWEQLTGGQVEVQSNPIYLRTSFTGMNWMSAYESQFYYREGLVAYLNGLEIYRDNLPMGVLYPGIKPTNSYETYSYHNVIRVGSEIVGKTNHLAVVLYSLSSSSSIQSIATPSLTFHARLSLYASSMPFSDEEHRCYPVQPNSMIFGTYGYTDYINDFNITSLVFFASPGSSVYIQYEVPLSQVNGFQHILPTGYGTMTQVSNQARLNGLDNWTSAENSNKLSQADLSVGGPVVFDFSSLDHTPYSQFRVKPLSISEIPAIIVELAPMVCYQHVDHPRIVPYLQSSYSWTIGEMIEVRPIANYQKLCYMDGDLPEGIEQTIGCGLSGSPSKEIDSYTVLVYWEDAYGTQSMEVTFTVMSKLGQFNEWLGILVGILLVLILLLLIYVFLSNKKKKNSTGKKEIVIQCHENRYIKFKGYRDVNNQCNCRQT